jgi:hypothetical protein
MGRRSLRVLKRVWDLEGLVGMEGRRDVARNCRARRINELVVECLLWLLLACIFLLFCWFWSLALGRFGPGYFFLVDYIFSPFCCFLLHPLSYWIFLLCVSYTLCFLWIFLLLLLFWSYFLVSCFGICWLERMGQNGNHFRFLGWKEFMGIDT